MEMEYICGKCVYVRSFLFGDRICMSNVCICKEFALWKLNIYIYV